MDTIRIKNISRHIGRIAERLTALDDEKTALLAEMEAIEEQLAQEERRTAASAPAPHFTPEEKIEIFMRLFRGRGDVFPKRWDNAKTGKSGYAPACRNEWVNGTCGKPQAHRRHRRGAGQFDLVHDETPEGSKRTTFWPASLR